MTNWVKFVENAAGSADRFGDTAVVPASIARAVAARLNECQLDRRTLIKEMSKNHLRSPATRTKVDS